MTPYEQFTATLVAALSARDGVLGLVALGSMAERGGRKPDRWSDHDFFVITHDAEPMRATREWLPDHERIAIWFRETPHGCKAVYDDGHLIEYAVFTPDELQLARVNDYRVLLDRERIADRMEAVAGRSEPPPDRQFLEGMFLTHILVAAGRAQRGELASARWMLTHAMKFLITLLGGGPDSLDPLRRVRHDAIEEAMRLAPLDAARALLDLYPADPRRIAAVSAVLQPPASTRTSPAER